MSESDACTFCLGGPARHFVVERTATGVEVGRYRRACAVCAELQLQAVLDPVTAAPGKRAPQPALPPPGAAASRMDPSAPASGHPETARQRAEQQTLFGKQRQAS